MEMLHSMKVLLNHLSGAGKVERDQKGGQGGRESWQSEEERVLQKGPEVLRPKYQDVALSNDGNPKSNKACPKLAA